LRDTWKALRLAEARRDDAILPGTPSNTLRRGGSDLEAFGSEMVAVAKDEHRTPRGLVGSILASTTMAISR
jgi:hypothetical protein